MEFALYLLCFLTAILIAVIVSKKIRMQLRGITEVIFKAIPSILTFIVGMIAVIAIGNIYSDWWGKNKGYILFFVCIFAFFWIIAKIDEKLGMFDKLRQFKKTKTIRITVHIFRGVFKEFGWAIIAVFGGGIWSIYKGVELTWKIWLTSYIILFPIRSIIYLVIRKLKEKVK